MKDYETYAQKYPAIVAMLVPAFLTTAIVCTYLPDIQGNWNTFLARIGAFIPVALIYGAIGYFARQLFRDASKRIFQFPLFKEDETEMPTTQLLLFTSDKRLSVNAIETIAGKIYKDFGIRLLSKTEEEEDTIEAKKTIVDAVGKIREATRNNPNLLNYNIDFGFCRNYLGATVYAVAIILIILIVNLLFGISDWKITLIALTVQLILGLLVFMSLKQRGFAYARALFNAYLSDKVYSWDGSKE
jgi:hypothetical protein